MKITVLDGKGVNPGDLSWDFLKEFGDYEVFDKTPTAQLTVARLQGATVAVTNKTPIDASILDACPTIKLICVLATGYNIIDCQAAIQRGIPVCNVPDYGTSAVAQFTIALLLEICHRIGHHDNLVHQGCWTKCESFCFWDTPQMELAGKTLGILGFGRIGQAVAAIANTLGMRVLAYSRTQREHTTVAEYVDFDTLLKESDVISLHCPLTDQTTGLIHAEIIKKMKDGSILINTSRGAILDEVAVANALRSGKLLAAAVDVAIKEPIPADSPLLSAPNCIITPHMAWAPKESRQRILHTTAENIRAFINGSPIHRVN